MLMSGRGTRRFDLGGKIFFEIQILKFMQKGSFKERFPLIRKGLTRLKVAFFVSKNNT